MRQRQLQFRRVAEARSVGSLEASAAAVLPLEELVKPDDLTHWDWAVFLLHTAAEVEHALMTQYLYAAYSLGPPFEGPDVPSDASAKATRWGNVLLGIAREEMAHLATVQNVLRLIGGPPNFEREDFPFRSQLYPFPFRLERLSRRSLAKYVAAEMPDDPSAGSGDPVVLAEILERAGAHGGEVNRVGVVYRTLIDLLGDPQRIMESDLRPMSAGTLQARRQDWFGSDTLLVRQLATREEAVAVLDLIARQGEGSDEPSPASAPSHYVRLLEMYSEFPETDEHARGGWFPTRRVPDNPNTTPEPSTDPEVEAGRITHPVSLLWAQLCNVRYRMLLLDLAHAFSVPGGMGEPPEFSPRGHLRNGAFFEMRGRPPLRRAGLRNMARKLTTLPLKEGADAGAAAQLVAGPPFELPFSLGLPDQERDRWRLHAALLESSRQFVSRIRAIGDDPILGELDAADAEMTAVVAGQLRGLP